MASRAKMLEYMSRYIEMRVDSLDASDAYDLAERYIREVEFGDATVAGLTDDQLFEHLEGYGIVEMYEAYEEEERIEAQLTDMRERHAFEVADLQVRHRVAEDALRQTLLDDAV